MSDLISRASINADYCKFDNQPMYGQVNVLHYKNRGYDVILEQDNDTFGLTIKQAKELVIKLNKIIDNHNLSCDK